MIPKALLLPKTAMCFRRASGGMVRTRSESKGSSVFPMGRGCILRIMLYFHKYEKELYSHGLWCFLVTLPRILQITKDFPYLSPQNTAKPLKLTKKYLTSILIKRYKI